MKATTLHRVWIGAKPPQDYLDNAQTWQEQNPGIKVWEWDEDAIKALGLENHALWELAPKIQPSRLVPRLLSDIARYEILWRFGGIYADHDYRALKPIGPWISDCSAFAVQEKPGLVANGLMGCEPGHSFLRALVDELPISVRKQPRQQTWRMAGPGFVTRVARNFPDVKILPASKFLPYHHSDLGPQQPEVPPDAVCDHTWGSARGQVSVIVPWRTDGPERTRALEAVLARYRVHRDWQVVLAEHNEGEFNKAQAVNEGVRRSFGDILVVADADLLCDGVEEAVEWCRKGARWVMPYTTLYRLDQGATGRVLRGGDPVKEHKNVDIRPYPGVIGGGLVVLQRTAFEKVPMDERFCVDEDTTILTSAGWKDYRSLQVGDLALTLNHRSGMSEWQPVQAVNVFGVHDHAMLSMESKNHSSLTTLNHRWPVVRRPDFRPGTGWGSRSVQRLWRTSAELTSEDRVPVAAQCADLPREPKYEDDLVELVAWFWTEGHIVKNRGKPGRNVIISQSLTANPDLCERITGVLRKLFGDPVERFARRGKSLNPHTPSWKNATHPSKPDLFQVNLNAEAGALVQAFAPGRVPSCEFLLSLTRAQLGLFIEVSLLADGHGSELAQKDPVAAERFQFACILAGFATSVRTRSLGPGKDAHYGYRMTSVTKRTAQKFGPSKGERQRVRYSGDVWCPTTPNGSWLAKRHGTVWFTGNSGWGGEDISWGLALRALLGIPRRVTANLYHLWHPSPWIGANVGTEENTALYKRYERASRRPTEMRRLIKEVKALVRV